jgi:hypothetical protein
MATAIVPSYKDHPFYKHTLQAQRNFRPPASHRSNYSTASSSTAGHRSQRSLHTTALDDFFTPKEKKTHEQIKQEKFMAEFYEKQRSGRPAKKNAIGIAVPESDLARMLRQNR